MPVDTACEVSRIDSGEETSARRATLFSVGLSTRTALSCREAHSLALDSLIGEVIYVTL